MEARRFEAVIEGTPGGGVAVALPFDPSAVWGAKDRHYVTGAIDGCQVRGSIREEREARYLKLGPSWNVGRFRDGDRVTVILAPEGPQLDTMAADLVAALVANPEARRFFESRATFYRNDYVTWIDSAKRPATRRRRIEQAIADLAAGREEHSKVSEAR